METVVIYHSHCIDGFTAAWAVWRHMNRIGKPGDKDVYVPASYGDDPPDVRDKEVIIVDLSYPRDVLLKMNDQASGLLVLDHHKTAEAALADLAFAHFDMQRSGAGMAWDHFHGKMTRPWLIDYVEDRDLWTWKLERSKQVNAWIGAQRREDFRMWDRLLETGQGFAEQQGAAVLTSLDRYIEEMAQQAKYIHIEVGVPRFRVPIINAPYINISELLHKLCAGEAFAVGWFQRKDGGFQYSLRSDDSGMDVSEVAKHFGGGGHKRSAGFLSARPPWELF